MNTKRRVSATQKARLMNQLNIPHTALLLAAVRSAESRKPSPLFVDEFAQMLASEESVRLFESMTPAAKDMLAVRVRFFDDQIMAAADRGFRQFVALGTGMDTRPLRQLSSPGQSLPVDTRWFELDFPHTLTYKKAILAKVKSRVHLKRIGLDILNPRMFASLQRNGFNKNEKTFFIIEGVMSYLTDEQIHKVVSNIAHESARGSQILMEIFGKSDRPSINSNDINSTSLRIISLMKFSGTGRQPPTTLFDEHGFVNDVDILTFSGNEKAHYGRFSFPPITSMIIPPELAFEWFELYTVNKDMLAAKS